MANNGTHTKVKQIHYQLQALRENFHQISLKQYVESNYKNADGSPVKIEDIYQELGINPMVTTVAQLWQTDHDAHFLFPEVIREAILKGSIDRSWYTNCIIASETTSQNQVTMPYMEFTDATPQDIKEAETIKKGKFTYGKKTVDLKKVGIGLDWSYEAFKHSTLNMTARYFEEVGRRLGLKKNRRLIDTLVNGEQNDGSESAAVLGVIDTGEKLTYRDETRVHINADLIARTYGIVITNAFQAEHLLNLDEHKIPFQGSPINPINIVTPIPRNVPVFVDANSPDNQYIFVDKSTAVVEFISEPLMVETDKIISKQVQEAYATEWQTFAIEHRNGRVIVDESLLYNTSTPANTHANYSFLAPITD